MKRRTVVAGVVAALSVGTFAAVREFDSPRQIGGDDEGGDGIIDGSLGGSDEADGRAPAAVDDSGPAGSRLGDIESVEIAVTIDEGPDTRDVTDIVLDALGFWEEHAEAYTGFDVEYELVDEDAYLTVELVETVTDCGIHTGDVWGCATVPRDRFPAELGATVETSLTDRGVFLTAVHELGHTLGLTHDDEPQYYMSTLQPRPWERRETAVHLDSEVRSGDVMAGLAWLTDNVDGVDGEFEESTDRNASIVVEMDPDACGEGFVSCSDWSDTYDDQAILRLDSDLDGDVHDWHVARLVASLAGPIPDVLDLDTSHEVRASDWWAA